MSQAQRNLGNQHRAGRYLIENETIADMRARRERGQTWGQIGLSFDVSPSAARRLVERRVGKPDVRTFLCGHDRSPANTIVNSTMPSGRCRTCREKSVRKQTAQRREVRIGRGDDIRIPTDGSAWGEMAAYGSRQLLIAYHAYWERHVANADRRAVKRRVG